MTNPGRPLTPTFIARAVALYQAGNSLENTSFELGCGRVRVKRALDEAKIPQRPKGESTTQSLLKYRAQGRYR